MFLNLITIAYTVKHKEKPFLFHNTSESKICTIKVTIRELWFLLLLFKTVIIFIMKVALSVFLITYMKHTCD